MYKVNIIKWIKNKIINADIIIKNENIEEIKSQLSKKWIIIYSYEKINEISWNIEVKINLENEINIIIDKNDINEWINFIKELELLDYVSYINFINNKLPEDKINEILNNLKKQKNIQEIKKVDEDFIKIIDETIQDAENIIPIISNIISPFELKNFQEKINYLKKIKRSSNYDQIRYLTSELISKLEEYELRLLEIEKKIEYENIAKDTIDSIKIINEIEKYENVQKLKKIWAKINWIIQNLYAKSKIFLYLNLLLKEIFIKWNNLEKYKKSILKYFEILAIFIIIELVILLLIKWDIWIYYYIFIISLFWIWIKSLYIFSFLNGKILLFILILYIILFIFIKDLIINTLVI